METMEKDTEQELEIPTVDITVSQAEREVEEVRLALDVERKSAERLKSRPYIDHLDDAIVNGEFIVPPGDKVIIERFVTLSGRPIWLDTKAYIVQSIDATTGNLDLFEPDLGQGAQSNYLTGPERGHTFKVAEKNTRLKGRGKSRPKKTKVERTDPKGKRGNPGKPGLRRIYDVKRLGVCTRLKGIAYVAPEGTRAKDGDRLLISAPVKGAVTVAPADGGWEERWEERPGA